MTTVADNGVNKFLQFCEAVSFEQLKAASAYSWLRFNPGKYISCSLNTNN